MARFVAVSGSPRTVLGIVTPLVHAVLGPRSGYFIVDWHTPEAPRVVLVSHEASAVARHASLPCLAAADARLDNLGELLQRCNLPREATASSAVLEAFLHWGAGFERKLEGDFAFAIWDGRNGRWYCGRDRFGVKPFYYSFDSRTFACASAPAGLSRLPWAPNAPNLLVGLGSLAGVSIDENASFYAGVSRLPPAHSLVHETGQSKLSRYWRLNAEKALTEGGSTFAEEWLRLFRQAVRRRRLDGDGSAVALSGGLDSSSVYGVLRESGARPAAYSAVFEHVALLDETPFAHAVVGKEQGLLHWTYPERITSSEHVRAAMDALEEPNLLDFYQIFWSVFESAANAGRRRIWTGYYGDAVVSHGWGWAQELASSRRFGALYRELRCSQTTPAAVRAFVRTLLSAHQPDAFRSARSAYRAECGELRELKGSCLTRTGQRAIQLSNRLYNALGNAARRRTSRELHVAALENSRADCGFVVTERMGHRFGVGTLHPFTDRELVEFSVALPVEEKRKHGQTRHILREAGRTLLPAIVRDRTSKAVFTPFLGWAFPRCFDMNELNHIHTKHNDLREYLVSPAHFTHGHGFPRIGPIDLGPFYRWMHAVFLTWYDRLKGHPPARHDNLRSIIQG
jgi:asparagine synthase (glutamine-hydrolysing)